MIDKKELLYFSLLNQHLLQKTDKSTVVSDLCGLQAAGKVEKGQGKTSHYPFYKAVKEKEGFNCVER